jgi:hypothetical protein
VGTHFHRPHPPLRSFITHHIHTSIHPVSSPRASGWEDVICPYIQPLTLSGRLASQGVGVVGVSKEQVRDLIVPAH